MPRRRRLSWLLIWVGLSVLLLPVSQAQVLPITVPKGKLRFDFGGKFELYDWRWRDGAREEAAADFQRSVVDPTFLPGLTDAEARLKRITGLSTVDLSLGRSAASRLVKLGTLGIGLAAGVTRWLTVFGNVPIVRVKVQPRFVLDTATATAGVNGANDVFGNAVTQGAARAFLGQLAQARANLLANLARGDYDADPNTKALAQRTVTRIEQLLADIGPLLEGTTAPAFFPLDRSATATRVKQVVQDLQATLQTLMVTTLTTLPPFPSSAVSDDEFLDFVTNPQGPIAARPFRDVPETIYVGDVELGAAVALVDRFPAGRYGAGFRTVLGATARLRTARLPRSDRFFEAGTGDRQPDIETSLTTDLSAGRLGARLQASYNLQLPGNQNRRVAPLTQPIAPSATLAGVRRDPGDVLRLSAQPFLRLAPLLSMFGSLDYWRRGEDRYSYVTGQPPIPDVDIQVLAAGSRSTALLVAGGISYAHAGIDKRGRTRLPLDASLRYERIIRSGTGIVPDANTVRIDLRFYTGLW